MYKSNNKWTGKKKTLLCASKFAYSIFLKVQYRFFGADLNLLVDDDHPLPIVLSKLMTSIEVRALFVEGIYRKSGALPTVRNIRKIVETEESKFR